MANPPNRVESTLLRRINERRLLEVIQRQGPSSRAMLTRASGLTAPTVSKAIDSLLQRGLVEELKPIEQALGRPATHDELDAATAQMTCDLAAAGIQIVRVHAVAQVRAALQQSATIGP